MLCKMSFVSVLAVLSPDQSLVDSYDEESEDEAEYQSEVLLG